MRVVASHSRNDQQHWRHKNSFRSKRKGTKVVKQSAIQKQKTSWNADFTVYDGCMMQGLTDGNSGHST